MSRTSEESVLLGKSASQSQRRRTSLTDIATLAGVSKVTVAKALHGTGGKNAGVSKLTAAKIRKIAKAMGYRPNIAARQLQGQKSGIIGAIIDSHAPGVISDLLSHLESRAHELGYRLMVGQSHGDIKQAESYASDFASRGIDGCFCLSWDYYDAQRGEYIRTIFSQIDKVVFLGLPLVDEEVHHYVGSDTAEGIRQLVHYLHGKGRNRISLLITQSQASAVLKRGSSYLAEIQKLGLNYGDEMIYRVNVLNSTHVTSEYLRSFVNDFVFVKKPNAIITLNDRIAAQVINQLRTAGLRVPEDIAVCGYDNAAFSDVNYPALTTVDQNNKEVAKAALDMMVSLIEGKEIPQECRHIRIKPQIVIRESA